MKTSVDILDAVSKRLGNASDAVVAKQTGIHPATISTVRAGRRSLPPLDCKKAALALGVEPAALVTIVTAERQGDDAIRRGLLKMARAALPAITAVGLYCAIPAPAHASPAAPPQDPMFIM